jgi:hypothetical protein
LSPAKLHIGGLRQIAVSRAISSKTVCISHRANVPRNVITNVLKWTNSDQISGHSIRINFEIRVREACCLIKRGTFVVKVKRTLTCV